MQEVMRKILGAVETGGQVYGQLDYSNFEEAYDNCDAETSLTIGAFCHYGPEAKDLLLRIYRADPAYWKKYDTVGLLGDLRSADWNHYTISRYSDKAKLIVKLISTETGKKCQNEMIYEQIDAYAQAVRQLGITEESAICMAVNWTHQGGIGAVQRILRKTEKPYTLDNLYRACQSDTGNQVGAYRERQAFVYRTLKEVYGTMDYINDKSTHWISNCGSDENGGYAGGQAGDQTGTEWRMREWYDRKYWDCVLRYETDPKVGELLAQLAIDAALNDKIGYDQYERDGYWHQLRSNGYDPSRIAMPCETDCSAGVIANTKAVGYLLDIPAFRNLTATYTGDMVRAYQTAGFTVLYDQKYLDRPDYLLPGDILLNEVHHTCTNVTRGASATQKPLEPATIVTVGKVKLPQLKQGAIGRAVRVVQMVVGVEEDGEFGPDTARAVKTYKKSKGLSSTSGTVSKEVWRCILEDLK